MKYLRNKTKLIAEIGCNHKGDMDIAIEMIEVASKYADIIKFQKRNNKELLTEEEFNKPHPVSYNSYGKTYGAHREFLEFDINQHKELKKECEKRNTTYSCSAWDITSAEDLIKMNLKIIKIPSACNLNKSLLSYIFENFKGEIHISMGMTTEEEIDKIFELSKKKNRSKDTVFYACTSTYPANHNQLYLNEITKYIKKYGNDILSVGFSGHHSGIAPDIAAITLGASYIERHFTLNRTWKGTDHAASLEPDGLRLLGRNMASVESALIYKPSNLLKEESDQLEKLKTVNTL